MTRDDLIHALHTAANSVEVNDDPESIFQILHELIGELSDFLNEHEYED